MFQELNHCPLCHSGQFRLFTHCTDYSVSGESFTIQQCQHCNLLFTNPRPLEKELGRYYQSSQYISHTNEGNSAINKMYKLVRAYTLQQKLKLVQLHSTTGELLDVGCGTGHFLEAAKNKGWTVEGVEVNDQARSIAVQKLQQSVYPYLSNIPFIRKFQAISLWHVLEHVYDLEQTISLLKELLHRKGKLFIAVPNPNSYDARHYREHWAAWDVPRHLYHFTQDVMQKLALKNGFTVKAIEPMYFDAFYVSLLSEKYRQKGGSMVNAFKIGMQSNIWANRNNKEYSSLIYILQHA